MEQLTSTPQDLQPAAGDAVATEGFDLEMVDLGPGYSPTLEAVDLCGCLNCACGSCMCGCIVYRA